jgi:predicted O-methyltransferase YrrM
VHAILSYIWHWLSAVNQHSLHSPFLFNFYLNTVKKEVVSADFDAIEQIRRQLIETKENISVRQLGADSKVNNELIRPVSAIAKNGITSASISKLLFNIIDYFQCKSIIELGTSFGINSMYMASNSQVRLCSFEGCQNTANLAQKNFDTLGYTNIELIIGNIDETLPQFVHHRNAKIDLVFMDANHKLQPTLNYFDELLKICHKQSIIIIDDIYWSPEMTRAWNILKNHDQVTTSVDLYDMGILFLRPELEKAHFKLMRLASLTLLD